jgi:hypothetical protein
MNKLKISVGILVIATGLLISCDDFFSHTIEIFSTIETPTNIEQEQKQSKKKEQKQENNSNQKIIKQH